MSAGLERTAIRQSNANETSYYADIYDEILETITAEQRHNASKATLPEDYAKMVTDAAVVPRPRAILHAG